MAKLVSQGHSLAAIKDYTLTQFILFHKAVEQNEAARRANFVVDVMTAVGSIASAPQKGEESAASQHLSMLRDLSLGIQNGDQSQ